MFARIRMTSLFNFGRRLELLILNLIKGAKSSVVPVYESEVSPARLRGTSLNAR